MHRSAKRLTVALLIAGFLAPSLSLAAADPASGETARILGTIFGPDGKSKVAGAVVHAYHLSSERSFSSAPTGPDGRYQINDLPYGYFDLAVETPTGLFVANQVANVPPAAKAVLSFTLQTYEDQAAGGEEEERRAFPGAETPPSGTASVQQRLTGRDFWRSPKGIAILGGAGGAVLLAIAASGGGSEPQASVSTP